MMEWIISSSALILMILALRSLLKGKISLRLQYGLWALVLLRLLIPVSFFSTGISVQNLTAEVSRQPAVQAAQEISEYSLPKQSYADAYAQVVQEYETQGIHVEALEGSEKEALDYEAMERMESDVTLGELLSDVALVLWLTGIAAVLGVTTLCNLRFHSRLRRNRIRLDIADTGLPVYVSALVQTPCLFGLFHPVIYLTPDVAEDKIKLRHVLEHEMTHYYHWDNVTAFLRCAALALHWYNPLVWIAAKVSRQDAELACDEGTVARLGEGERSNYGRTLIQLTCDHSQLSDVMLTATTMTGSAKSIKERIRCIAQQPKMAAITLIVVILIVAVAVGCTFTGAKEDAPDQEEVLALLEREGQSHLNKIAVVQLDEESYGTDGVAIFLPEEIVMDYFHANVGGTDRNGNVVSLQGEIHWESGKWIIVEDLEQYQELIFQSFYSLDPEDTAPDKQRNVDLLHLEQAAANRTNGAIYDGNMEKLLMDENARAVGDVLSASPGSVAASSDLPQLVKAEQAAQQGLYLFEAENEFVLADDSILEHTMYFLMRYDGGWESVATIEADELDALYASEEMLEKYPTKYDAAAIEAYQNPVEMTIPPETDDPLADPLTVLKAVLEDIGNQNVPVALSLADSDAVLSCRDVPNGGYYANAFANCTYAPNDWSEEPGSAFGAIDIRGKNQSLIIYEDSDFVALWDGSEMYPFQLIHNGESLGEILRSWYDEAEFAALSSSDYHYLNALNIGDRNQPWLEAAQEYCEAAESIYLKTTSGSKYKYSFVQCVVEAADDQTEHFRQTGAIDENTWCFYLTTIFVPGNERALRESMAGNTGLYEGDDPNVPEGAYEYQRCCYITKGEDGLWHGAIVGTGW